MVVYVYVIIDQCGSSRLEYHTSLLIECSKYSIIDYITHCHTTSIIIKYNFCSLFYSTDTVLSTLYRVEDCSLTRAAGSTKCQHKNNHTQHEGIDTKQSVELC